MKQTKSRKLNKNAGFSLVELLIAVTILAIIVIPLLHLFVTSTRMNVKSRQTLRATTVAQDIMEGLKAYDIDELKAQFNNPIEGFYVINDQLVKGGVSEDFDREESQNGLDAEGNINPGLYYFTMEGVSMQGSVYDALIEVDARGYMKSPSGTPAESHDQKFNSTGFAKLPGIDGESIGGGSGKDAVYTQDATLTTRMLKKINEHFYYNLDGGTDPNWDWEESGWFTEENIKSGSGVFVSRNITIDLTDSHTTDEDGNPIINAAVTYEYECTRNVGEPKKAKLYGEDMYGQEINGLSPFADFTSGRLYLFYYPLYGDGVWDEIITINNHADIPLQIYIAKQVERGDLGVADPTKETGTKLTDAQLMVAEQNYYPTVKITGGSIDKTEIMTNLQYNLADKKYLDGEGAVASLAGNVSFYVDGHYKEQTDLNIFDLSGVRSEAGSAPGTNDEITEVIYDVKVSVYKEGAAAKGFTDEDRMIVIEGSKNN